MANRGTMTKAEMLTEMMNIINSDELKALEDKLGRLIKEHELTFGYYLIHGRSYWWGYRMMVQQYERAAMAKHFHDVLHSRRWFEYNRWLSDIKEEMAKLADVVAGFED